MNRKLLHASFVTQNRAIAAFATWVDCEHCQLGILVLEHMKAEHVDRSALASTRHTGNANAPRLPSVGQAFLNNLLSNRLMVGIQALDKCHRLPKHCSVALENSLNIVVDRELRTALATLHVGIDDGHLLNTCIHLQPSVLLIVFGMVDVGCLHIVVPSDFFLLLLSEKPLITFIYCVLCNLASHL